jgi:hypothetical protein
MIPEWLIHGFAIFGFIVTCFASYLVIAAGLRTRREREDQSDA